MDKFHQPVNIQPPGWGRNCKADEVGLVIIVPLRKIFLNIADELKNDKKIVLVVESVISLLRKNNSMYYIEHDER